MVPVANDTTSTSTTTTTTATTKPAISCLNALRKAISKFGSIYDIPEEETCKLFWNFWDAEELIDDMIFFVADGQEESKQMQQCAIQVCRHSRLHRPELNIKVDWNATLAFNLICHSEYRLRVSVCRYAEDRNSSICRLVVDEESAMEVFASPIEGSQLKASKSASFEACGLSFPQVYFSVNNFDSCFEHIRLRPGNILIIELIRTDCNIQKSEKGAAYSKITTSEEDRSIIFQGAIEFDSVQHAVSAKESKGIVLMNGPDGFGEAQIQVITQEEKQVHRALVRINRLLRSVLSQTEEKTATAAPILDLECRLKFIRMHWLDILSKVTNKQ